MAELKEKENIEKSATAEQIKSLLGDPKTVNFGLQAIVFLFKSALRHRANIDSADVFSDLASVYAFWHKMPRSLVKKPYADMPRTIEKQLPLLLLKHLTLHEIIKLQQWLAGQEEISTFMRGENLFQHLAEVWSNRIEFDNSIVDALRKAAKLYRSEQPQMMLPVFEDFLQRIAGLLLQSPEKMQILLQITIKDLYKKYGNDITNIKVIDDAVLGMFSLRFISSVVLRFTNISTMPPDFLHGFQKEFNFLELSKAIQKLTSNKQDASAWATNLGDIAHETAMKHKADLLASLKVLHGRVHAKQAGSVQAADNTVKAYIIALLQKINARMQELDPDNSLAGKLGNSEQQKVDYQQYKKENSTKGGTVHAGSQNANQIDPKMRKRSNTVTNVRLSGMFANFAQGYEENLKNHVELKQLKAMLLALPAVLQMNLLADEINSLPSNGTEIERRPRSRTYGGPVGHTRSMAGFFNDDIMAGIMRQQERQQQSPQFSDGSAIVGSPPKKSK